MLLGWWRHDAVNTTRRIGAIAFNRWRMIGVFVMLAMLLPVAVFREVSELIAGDVVESSGLVGVFLGDTFLFLALARLGPRRVSMLFAGHAPLTRCWGLDFCPRF